MAPTHLNYKDERTDNLLTLKQSIASIRKKRNGHVQSAAIFQIYNNF